MSSSSTNKRHASPVSPGLWCVLLLINWCSLLPAAEPATEPPVLLHVQASMSPLDIPPDTTPGPEPGREAEVDVVVTAEMISSLPATELVHDPDNALAEVGATMGKLPASLLKRLKDPDDPLLGTDPERMRRKELDEQLKLARYCRTKRLTAEAAARLVQLLGEDSPEVIQQAALLELALVAEDQNDSARAQQIYSQFLSRWPDDLRVPQVLLQQAILFRQMGLNNLALSKLYAVMTSSLVLKNDQFGYYQRLVLLAQTEIAETHFQIGKYEEAADFYSRLLVQNHPALNQAQIHYKLVKSLAALDHPGEVVARAEEFVNRYPRAPELPEVRFHLALALKKLGQDNESLQQVLTLLQEQKDTRQHPELWAYWQQRAGNEIANRLYREGDYPGALKIYLKLVELSSTADWQVPVQYQIGVTYERLLQPKLASDTYANILLRETEMGTNSTPALKTVFDMARWRKDFIKWHGQAEDKTRSLAAANNSSETQTEATHE